MAPFLPPAESSPAVDTVEGGACVTVVVTATVDGGAVGTTTGEGVGVGAVDSGPLST